MKKSVLMLAMAMIIGFGFAVAYMQTRAYGEGSSEKGSEVSYFEASHDVSRLMGLEVNNQQGENLAAVKDFVVDAHGQIAFAILSYGGLLGIGSKLVAVPFGALSYDPAGRLFVLNMSKEKLASAPKYHNRADLSNPRLSGDIYEFFGQHPYWTEKNTENQEHMGKSGTAETR